MRLAVPAALTALLAFAASCGSSTTTGNADEQDGGDLIPAGQDGSTLTAGAGGRGGTGGGLSTDSGFGTGGIASGGGAGVAGNGGTGGSDPALDAMNDPIVNDPACPPTNPVADTACPEFGLVCKYGEDLNCRSRWGCGQVCDPVCGSELSWSQNFAERDCPGLCPATEPQPGQACSGIGTLCTYGDDPVCRSEWECRDGSWVVLVPARDCQRTDVYCPAEPPIGETCSLEEVTPRDARCVYKYGAVCTCSCIWDLGGQGATGLQTHWACVIPSPLNPWIWIPDCPLAVPAPGTPCVGDAECSYVPADICETPSSILISARCVAGFWQVTP